LRYVVSPNLTAGTLVSLTATGDVDIIEEDVAPPKYIVPEDAVAFSVRSSGPDGIDASSDTPATNKKVITGSTTTPADDMVIWGSRYVMFARLLQAGQTLTLN